MHNGKLIEYLISRKVSIPFAKQYLKEAYYTVHDKKYFALAFENNLGGFELRNATFKTGSSPKYFTTIPGADGSRINVFEGFMDYLSCCTHFKKKPRYTTIILNSLSFLPLTLNRLNESGIQAVNLYLDNDLAGKTASKRIIDTCKKVNDLAPLIYPGHKDFNEFLMAN